MKEKTIKRDSLSKNFIFQFLYQAIVLVIPLIESPYLTRTLGDTKLGVYSFVNSIATYFVLFAMLGIANHGQRIIARNSDKKEELGRAFWSLLFLHTLVSILFLLLFIVFAVLFGGDNKLIYYLEIFYVASALFDITWFFYGIESFKGVVIRNAIIKTAACILVFTLVKKQSDLWLYTLIESLAIFLGQIVLLPQAFKLCKPTKFTKSDIKAHIKPLLVFFISILASSLFTVFDKTLLGIMHTKESVAYYEFSNRVVSVPKVIIGVIATIMLPKSCKLVEKGDVHLQRQYLTYSFFYSSFIGIGSFFGLLAVSQQFAIIYFGQDFAVCGYVMIALAPVIYSVGVGNVVRTQCMIPNGMDKSYTLAIVVGAILNILLSIALIPFLGIYGAVIGSVVAEFFELFYQIIACKKYINFASLLKQFFGFTIIGAMMYGAIMIISLFLSNGIFSLIIKVGVGLFIYCVLSLVYTFFFEKNIWSLFVLKIKKDK